MILKFSFNYSSTSLVYEKIILRTSKLFDLESSLLRVGDELLLYVKSEDTDVLENFANKLSLELPHSIFLHDTQASVVEDMQGDSFHLPQTPKMPMPFCPKCLEEFMNEENENHNNIFHECEVCGYDVAGEKDNYKEKIQTAANSINDGLTLEVYAFYGKYYLGKLSAKCKDFDFDVLSYDLYTIENYTNATKNEIVALGAMEKPLLKLRRNVKFQMDFEEVTAEFIRFKLAFV